MCYQSYYRCSVCRYQMFANSWKCFNINVMCLNKILNMHICSRESIYLSVVSYSVPSLHKRDKLVERCIFDISSFRHCFIARRLCGCWRWNSYNVFYAGHGCRLDGPDDGWRDLQSRTKQSGLWRLCQDKARGRKDRAGKTRITIEKRYYQLYGSCSSFWKEKKNIYFNVLIPLHINVKWSFVIILLFRVKSIVKELS